MTIQKAIRILDAFIVKYQMEAEDLLSPQRSWNQNFDCLKELAATMSDSKRGDAQVLRLIKKELLVNCKHPKKMRDIDPKGNWYCMNCNQDL